MHVPNLCLFVCVCVVLSTDRSGGSNNIRTTLAHRWEEGKIGDVGESYRLQKATRRG